MNYIEDVMSWQEDNSVIDRLVQQWTGVGVPLDSDSRPVPEEGEEG